MFLLIDNPNKICLEWILSENSENIVYNELSGNSKYSLEWIFRF